MSETNSPRQNHLRILIADDVQATLKSTQLMLRMIPGVEIVATAGNGRQAIEMAEAYKPDIALVDIAMPEVDGLSAIRTMLSRRPDMICIIMSVEGQESTWEEARKHGASDYLVKPFTPEELLDSIERAGQTIISRRPARTYTAPLRLKQTAPLRRGQTSELRERRTDRLLRLAARYIESRRTDDEALSVFEELAADPNCEIRWLRSLAMMYVLRKKWARLKALAERLEQQTELSGSDMITK